MTSTWYWSLPYQSFCWEAPPITSYHTIIGKLDHDNGILAYIAHSIQVYPGMVYLPDILVDFLHGMVRVIHIDIDCMGKYNPIICTYNLDLQNPPG